MDTLGQEAARGTSQVLIPGSELLPVKNPLVPPYTGILRVNAKFLNGGEADGTAFVISPNSVLTAVHTLWNVELKQFATIMELSGGKIDDTPVQKLFCDEGDIRRLGRVPTIIDFAVLRVQGAPFAGLAQFVPVVATDAELNAMSVYIPGLPNDMIGMYEAPAKSLYKVDTFELLYKISTVGGMSGSPVIWQQAAAPYNVVGVHSEGYTGNDPANYAMRITRDRLNAINHWLSAS